MLFDLRVNEKKIARIVKILMGLLLVSLSVESYSQGVANFIDSSIAAPKTVASFGDAKILPADSKFDSVAASFDGDGDYLSISPLPFSINTNILTIEAWIYIETLPAWGWPIVSQNTNASGGEQEFFVSGASDKPSAQGKLRFYRGTGVGNPIDIVSSSVISQNQWVHVAVSFDGTTVKLFVNGKLDASASASVGWVVTNQPFYVARQIVPSYPASQSYASGKISDLRITNDNARYRTNFIPSYPEVINPAKVYDPYWYQNSLLLLANADNGNRNLVDSSPAPKQIAVSGDTKISTSKFTSGASSIFFDGGGDYATTSYSEDFNLSNTDFTIECWTYITNYSGANLYGTILSKRMSGADFDYTVFVNGDRKVLVFTYGTSAGGRHDLETPLNSVMLNTWYHFAVTVQGTTIKLFLNGTIVGTYQLDGPLRNRVLPVEFGQSLWYWSSFFSGYVDDIRITKGIARYTSNFTPAPLQLLNPPLPTTTGDSSWQKVSLLLNSNDINGSKNVSDSSLNPKNVVAQGDAKISTAQSKFGGASVALDGNGDYISVPSSKAFEFGTGDFTIESWIYINDNAPLDSQNVRNMALFESTNPSATFQLIILGDSNKTGTGIFIWSPGVGSIIGYVNISQKTWHHVAYVRKQGVINLFVDGVLVGSGNNNQYFGETSYLIGYQNQQGMQRFFNGYIDDFRVTNGFARYTSNFTPPIAQLDPGVFSEDPYGDHVSLLLVNKGSLPPRILKSSPISNNQSLSTLDIFFNNALDESTFTATDISVVDQANNNYPVSKITKIGDTQYRLSFDSPLQNGNFTLTIGPNIKGQNGLILDQNNNGKGGESDDIYTQIFTIDTLAPAAAILDTYPSVVNNSTFTFKGTKEPGSKVLMNSQTIVDANSSATWTYNAQLVDGKNTFNFVLLDAVGNPSTVTQANITYENTPPGAVDVNVSAVGNGTELNLSWLSYLDVLNGNDIASFKIYYSLNPYTDIQNAILYKEVPSAVRMYALKELERNKAYYISVVAFDTAGNYIGQVTALPYTPIDNQPPLGLSNLQIQASMNSLLLSWNPAIDTDGDLSLYRISYFENGTQKFIDLKQQDVGAANPVNYTLSNLLPATGYDLQVFAVDQTGNMSVKLNKTGATLLANPNAIHVEPGNASANLSWSAVQPYNLIDHYAVYVQQSAFTSVENLAPAQIVPKGGMNQSVISTAITSLTNGHKVYVAITTVNISGGEFKTVQAVAVTPIEDKDGPIINGALYISDTGNVNLDAAPTLSSSGKLTINATDVSKVNRIAFSLDGEPLSSVVVTNVNGAYEQQLDLLTLNDGSHSIAIDAYDNLENVTHKVYSVTVNLAAPVAPTITTPAQDVTVNKNSTVLTGTSISGSKVSISNNKTEIASDVSVDSNGKFTATINLEEGLNKLTAKAQYIGHSKWSIDSAVRNITVNTSIPNAPTGLTAQSGKQGQVFLNWNVVTSADANNQVKGYNLYRSSQNFNNIANAGVVKINTQLLTGISFTDLVVQDGNYFYAVSAVNQVGNESNLSPTINALADSQGPKIVQLAYVNDGKKDPLSGRMGLGVVHVTATFSEPLRNNPYFAIVPDKGVPITVELNKNYSDEKQYTGQFQIANSTPSGTAYAVMSAYDAVGNRGTNIDQGATIIIDTQGPDVTNLTLTPTEPLKVDAVNGLAVNVSIKLNDETNHGDMPKLVPLLNGAIVAGYEQGITLAHDSNSAIGNPVWAGSFNLPNSAARSAQAVLSFNYAAEDDLNNSSNKIIGKNQFQVYQGDLPPLATPSELIAKALPAGKVKLTWKAVDKAISYVLYRQGPNDSSLIALDPISVNEFIDQTSVDGTYLYAVASIRNDNGQESRSAKSETVSVKTDHISPVAPQQLTLELNGAGLVARWVAPALDTQGNPQQQDGVTYNLYRTALKSGQQVTDLTGLTPIQTRIPALIALDTKPSTTEHSYFVTAVDAAGNESAPSTTMYLNFGLLPVNQLQVALDNNGYPTLTWQHNGVGIKSYRVSRHTGNETAVLLTPEDIKHISTTTSYVDTTYNSNQVSRGANQEVVYSVVAVDANNVESLPHELKLPALSVNVEKTKEISLDRGVMNQVMFRVNNKGKTDASRLRLSVTLTENGTVKVHHSEYFDLTAEGSVLVPVIIGGYSKLGGIADLVLSIEQQPQTNESIKITELETVLVGNSSLSASIQTQDFTRGAQGKASFSITNSSDVETEIVLANNNGNADSTEVRLVLEDLQGNVLAQQPVKQFTGGVISVASGQMVARIAPNSTFTSAQFTINVPQAAPDRVKLRLVIDKYHYHLGQNTHVEITGVGTSKDIQLSDTPYYAEIESIIPAVVYAANDNVTITGRVINRSNSQPMASVPITLVYTVRGFERKSTVYADATGKFVFVYKSDGASGKYVVSAVHPDVTDRPNQGQFIIEGGSVSPQDVDLRIPRNYTQKIPVRINAGYDSTLNNVRVTLLASNTNQNAQLPAGITVSADSIAQINPATSTSLTINFSGDNNATDTGLVSYRVEADNHTGANALGIVNLHYNLQQAAPAVATTPTYIDTGVGLEQEVIENLVITNKGLDVLRNASIELTTKDASALPAWIMLVTAPSLGDLAIGEERAIQLTAKPDANTAEGNYEFKLQVKGDNLSTYSLPVFVRVTQSGKGKAFFHVSDIYTATLDKNNQRIGGVGSSTITLQNENVLSDVFTLNTDVKGETTFENIPAGRYSYRVSAFDHESKTGRIWIKPSVTSSQEVFLMNNLVNIEWSVREITVEDRYEVKLDATFKTQVPIALVMISPLNVQLPVMKKGEVYQGELTLTNHGLIRAENVQQVLPANNAYVRFEFLRAIPSTLLPGEVFILPYKVQAIGDFNPEADAQASGGGCGGFNASYTVNYQSTCSNNTIAPGNAQSSFNSNWGGSPCGGGGGGSSGLTQTLSYGGGSGGGGVIYSQGGSSITSGGKKCNNPDPNKNTCDTGNGDGN